MFHSSRGEGWLPTSPTLIVSSNSSVSSGSWSWRSISSSLSSNDFLEAVLIWYCNYTDPVTWPNLTLPKHEKGKSFNSIKFTVSVIGITVGCFNQYIGITYIVHTYICLLVYLYSEGTYVWVCAYVHAQLLCFAGISSRNTVCMCKDTQTATTFKAAHISILEEVLKQLL